MNINDCLSTFWGAHQLDALPDTPSLESLSSVQLELEINK